MRDTHIYILKSLLYLAALSLAFGSVSAQAQMTRPADEMPPLLPHVNCVEAKCDITFSGVFDGKTLTTEPLVMQASAEDGAYWQPRIISAESLKMDGIDAPFGWMIGENENEMELYLTSLKDPQDETYEPGLFMIEQRAGFEHVGVAYHFFAPRYDRTALATARVIKPSMGPQKRVTSANITGVRVQSQAYNPETGGFNPTYEQYEWYSGADSEMLGSAEEMEGIYEQNDAISNVYIPEKN